VKTTNNQIPNSVGTETNKIKMESTNKKKKEVREGSRGIKIRNKVLKEMIEMRARMERSNTKISNTNREEKITEEITTTIEVIEVRQGQEATT